MNGVRVLPLFLALPLCLGVPTAHATCWELGKEDAGHRRPSLSNEFKAAEFVVIGRAKQERNISGPTDPQGYEWTVYDVEVLEPLKGSPPHTVKLLSENSSARFPMSLGQSYVLFVSHEPTPERAGSTELPQDYIDNCGNSGLLETSSDRALEARRLSKHQNDAGP
jgi:hypothetical protein